MKAAFALSSLLGFVSLADSASAKVYQQPATIASETRVSPAIALLNWDVVDIANDTYMQQRLNASLLSQLLQRTNLCSGLSCHYQTYSFANALLITVPYDAGATKVSLMLSEPVSTNEALSYARVLDTRSEIDFDRAEIDSKSGDRVYMGCFEQPEDDDDTFPSGCSVRLSMTAEGQVSKVSVHHGEP